MNPLELVKLTTLMELTRGNQDIQIGLIDGPVATDHPDLADTQIRLLGTSESGKPPPTDGVACQHGTYVAGILVARRTAAAPAIAPACTLLVRPIFGETARGLEFMPHAAPQELAAAIRECVQAGARLLNLSIAIVQPTIQATAVLTEALTYAAQRGVIIVAAAGNQAMMGGTILTRHPGVIPVAACDQQGRPLAYSNLSNSIGRRGVNAPGERIASLAATGGSVVGGGTSAAVPFVTGALALLWSLFPTASAGAVLLAVTQAITVRRKTVVPPLLDAWAAYEALAKMSVRR